jgi:hypothetical protein
MSGKMKWFLWLKRLGVTLLLLLVVSGISFFIVLWGWNQNLTPETQAHSASSVTDAWQEFLQGVVENGAVNYAVARERRAELERIVAAYAESGPELTPELFSEPASRFAWYLNAYNALVLYAVLATGVQQSIHEVTVPVVPLPGYGFFYSLYFDFDGERINLYQLEHEVIRGQFVDARLHAALNCASASCPPLQPFAFRAENLEVQLAQVATNMASVAPWMRVDAAAQTVHLSSIYLWYQSDFEAHATAVGAGNTVMHWIRFHTEPELHGLLDQAIAEQWAIVHETYDWSLNQASDP